MCHCVPLLDPIPNPQGPLMVLSSGQCLELPLCPISKPGCARVRCSPAGQGPVSEGRTRQKPAPRCGHRFPLLCAGPAGCLPWPLHLRGWGLNGHWPSPTGTHVAQLRTRQQLCQDPAQDSWGVAWGSSRRPEGGWGFVEGQKP